MMRQGNSKTVYVLVGCRVFDVGWFTAEAQVVRKNPQDLSRVIYKMMFESRASGVLAKNNAGMKRIR